jgi:hypothetical protein
MKICIVTCNIGNYDIPHNLNIYNKERFDWYYFTDKEIKNNWINILLSNIYFQTNDYKLLNSISSKNEYTKNRMKTKFIKIQTHNISIIKEKKYDYIIWIDSSFKINNKNFVNDIINLIDKNKEIILFDHYHEKEKNIQGEIKRCRSWKRKSCLNQKFDEQINNYINKGYIDDKLYCGGFFIRKNNNKMNNMFDEWYLHNQKYSYRDQTSLPYLLWNHKIEIHVIKGYIDKSPLIGEKITKKRKDNILNVLTILIPATPRNEIHEKSCLKFLKFIQESNKIKNTFDRINVIVNLDIPNFLNDEDKINKCINNFIKFQSNDIIHVSVYKVTKPCFSNAWRNLFNKCNNFINKKDKNIFFWFEDDWAMDKTRLNDIENNIIKFHKNNKYEFMQFVNEIPSGPPFFFKLWYFNIVLKFLNKYKKNIDPEDAMKELFKRNVWRRKKFKDKIKLLIVSNREDKLFYDIGTEWRDNQKIKKWDRNNNEIEKKWEL